ncbi:MAG: RHS repeat-associated core domain-containing protein, partial [Acidobacteriota bacterium]
TALVGGLKIMPLWPREVRHVSPETGFIYVRSRYYDPAAGRYISRNPAGLAAGLNPYLYAANNPVRFADPLGTGTLLTPGADRAASMVQAALKQSVPPGTRPGAIPPVTTSPTQTLDLFQAFIRTLSDLFSEQAARPFLAPARDTGSPAHNGPRDFLRTFPIIPPLDDLPSFDAGCPRRPVSPPIQAVR